MRYIRIGKHSCRINNELAIYSVIQNVSGSTLGVSHHITIRIDSSSVKISGHGDKKSGTVSLKRDIKI